MHAHNDSLTAQKHKATFAPSVVALIELCKDAMLDLAGAWTHLRKCRTKELVCDGLFSG